MGIFNWLRFGKKKKERKAAPAPRPQSAEISAAFWDKVQSGTHAPATPAMPAAPAAPPAAGPGRCFRKFEPDLPRRPLPPPPADAPKHEAPAPCDRTPEELNNALDALASQAIAELQKSRQPPVQLLREIEETLRWGADANFLSHYRNGTRQQVHTDISIFGQVLDNAYRHEEQAEPLVRLLLKYGADPLLPYDKLPVPISLMEKAAYTSPEFIPLMTGAPAFDARRMPLKEVLHFLALSKNRGESSEIAAQAVRAILKAGVPADNRDIPGEAGELLRHEQRKMALSEKARPEKGAPPTPPRTPAPKAAVAETMRRRSSAGNAN